MEDVDLLDNFIHIRLKYGGLIPEIPPDMDPTGRTDLLKVIDNGMKDGLIEEYDPFVENAVLSINGYMIKIIALDSDESKLLQAPIHMVASVGYLHEDDHHVVVAIKIGDIGGNKDISDLAILYCDSADTAVLICKMLERCFDAVFAELSNMKLAKKMTHNRSLSHQSSNGNCQSPHVGHHNTALNESHSASAASSTSRQIGLSFMTGSTTDINKMRNNRNGAGAAGRGGGGGSDKNWFPVDDSTSNPINNDLRRRRFAVPNSSTTTQSDAERGRDLSMTPAELIQEYMRMLYVHLNADELKCFAILLKRWTSENLPFPEFLQKVLELYGPERKHLLARMRPFVTELDVHYFDTFLELSGITENAESSIASCSPASDSIYSRNSAEFANLRVMMLPPTAAAGDSAGLSVDDASVSSLSLAANTVLLRPPKPAAHRHVVATSSESPSARNTGTNIELRSLSSAPQPQPN